MLPLIPLVTALISGVPSIIKAVKAVKEIDDDKTNKKLYSHLIEEPDASVAIVKKKIQELTEIPERLPDLNALKRQIAIGMIKGTRLAKWIDKRSGDDNDIGTIVDFAWLLFKLVKGKSS